MKDKFIVYTDGGARGNPGPAAIGVVIYSADHTLLKEYGEAIGETTNNVAEYRAAISALQKIKAMFGKERSRESIVEVNTDSELVVRQLTGKYKIEEERLFALFIKIWNLKMDFGEVQFRHIPREKNRDADRLVNQALDRDQKNLFSKDV